jgi:hypothetical protein
MVTLTCPGDWLTVAPTAESVTEHFAALCKRYAPWGEELIGPWKKEFQHRGAPHLHLSSTPPMRFTTITDPDTGQRREVDFKTWLSITWADTVGHPDPEQRRKHRAASTGVDYAEGIRLTDPRRMAVYFAKYGTAGGKECQHRVPEEWTSCYLICDDCGRDYTPTATSAPTAVIPRPRSSSSTPPAGSGATAAYGPSSPPDTSPRRTGFAPDASSAAAKGLTKRVRRQRVDQATGRVYYRTTTCARNCSAK